MFIGEITDMEVLSDFASVTYEYYQNNIKPSRRIITMKEELSIDIIGLAGACSYALDCIEAELVNIKNKHGKRVAYISICMAEYWKIEGDELQDLAMCALLHDNALTQYISEELKRDSVINCKKDLSKKKQIFIVFMVKKILLKFHLKQMCQM